MENRVQRLPEIVAKKIRSIIIEHSLSEGERLPSETELTNHFNVSRSTLREAVKILEAENVVVIKQGRGTYTAKKTGMISDPLGLSFADRDTLLPNLLEARKLMEPAIAFLAAQRRTAENLKQMQASIRDMELANQKGEDYTRYDYRFHCILAECTQNDVLNRILPLICDSINAGYMRTARVKGSYEKANYWHRKIYGAVLQQKPVEAEQAVLEHLSQTLMDVRHNTEGEEL
ncbi:MAG: FadR/GntR family transcriptional regulator [Eubacteriales bacterium]|jgi:DNA-binding FadR family transcriptional regulator|nr:FadR/GntR family transcriptional regulator [Eubacteriales bacterium]MDD4105341.1 FadR/GntR family transcriptional regulator [Eubacteriales bacterium]MDD4710654.1 FadR/GntR family transcriptional regulator [Eubacteriales bacterium]NLO15984.1 FadR family transcriptional regulator [Clostridiales bacterium]